MQKTSVILIGFLFIYSTAACVQIPASQTQEFPTASIVIEDSPTPQPTDTPQLLPTDAEPTPTQELTQSREFISVPATDLFNRIIFVDPLNPQRMAYCAPGEIRLSQDSGRTWPDSISTQGITQIAAQSGYTIFDQDSACHSVTLDSNYPDSFYTVFITAMEAYGAPPVFYMGFLTTDRGQNWQFVQAPNQTSIEDFGGFWNLYGNSVEVLYSNTASSNEVTINLLSQETIDGGNTWDSETLRCADSNACLRWGPAPSNIPGMGSPLPQSVLISKDAGQNWSRVDPMVELRAPSPNQLVELPDESWMIISGSIELSASGGGTSPVRISKDDGLTWQDIELPPISSDVSQFNYYPGLQILPDGSFLSQGTESSVWYWLSPELINWCLIESNKLPNFPVYLQTAADELLWVDPQNYEVISIPIAAVKCGIN